MVTSLPPPPTSCTPFPASKRFGGSESFPLPPVLPLTVTLRTAEPQRLPPFLGSALHGALARAVYRTVCAFPKRSQCPGCPLYARCAYPALFDTPAAADDTLRALGIRDQAPRPLVLAPEPGWTRASGNPFRLAADRELPFRLTLIGRAIHDLPVVTVALKAMARRGLGIPADAGTERRRASLQLVRVTTIGGEHAVYDAASDRFTPPPPSTADHEGAGGEATVEFVTPLRLKHQGKLASVIAPAEFFAALAQRANALAVLHGAGAPVVDATAIAAVAGRIEALACRLRRVHVTRYSARQRARMQWPGLMGNVRWRGDALRDLWPLLRFGELIQVGKGTALGFGRYRVA
jgi:CRISPR-associated endoribonuclease Cas6